MSGVGLFQGRGGTWPCSFPQVIERRSFLVTSRQSRASKVFLKR
jgi:hypothetical protein